MLKESTIVLLVGTALLLVTAGVPLAGAQPGMEDPFPSHGELVEALEGFASHPWVTVDQIGASGQGKSIHLVQVADPNSSTPMDERAVTLLLTQQHGNEPAGTPAALRLLANITSGGHPTAWLENQVVLILPMANPDGGDADARQNADGVDINRDHIALATTEARAIHDALNAWDIHVALDHHEYGGAGLGNPVPVRIYDYDLTTLFPVHGNVRGPAVEAAGELMYEAIWPAAQAQGFSANEYGEQTVNGEPVGHVAGGPDPGILRNHLGLHNVAGLLIETRIDAHPNPFHTPERRIQIHTVVMESTLEHVHDNAERYIGAKRAAEQAALLFPARAYQEGEPTGVLPPAFHLPAEEGIKSTIHAHGLETLQSPEGPVVLPLGTELQGHAAALVHPDSSRKITDGAVAAELTTPNGSDDPPEATSSETDNTPAPSMAIGVVLAGLAAGIASKRRGR